MPMGKASAIFAEGFEVPNKNPQGENTLRAL
jgi:hypothetical protein